jgi:hypothetical protein
MSDQNLQLKKLVKFHQDSAGYYHAYANITTEDDLREIFKSLAEGRTQMAASLKPLLSEEVEKELWMLRNVLSYLQQGWRNMKLALIVNNRPEILRHCLQNEHEVLGKYEQLIYGVEEPDEVFRQGIYHHQLLKTSIERILSTPYVKFSQQKNMRIELVVKPA